MTRWPLSLRVITLVVTVAIVILGPTGLWTWYQAGKAAEERVEETLISTAYRLRQSLGQSLYEFDTLTAERTIQAELRTPGILKIKVVFWGRNTEDPLVVSNGNGLEPVQRTWSIIGGPLSRQREVGHLTLWVDQWPLKSEALQQALTAMAINVLVIASVCLVLAFAATKTLTAPLAALSKKLQDGNLKDLGDPGRPTLPELRGVAITLVDLLQALDQERHSVSIREQELQTMLDTLTTGIIATDAGNIVRRINPAAASLTGCDKQVSLGQPITELLDCRHPATDVPVTSSLAMADVERDHKAHFETFALRSHSGHDHMVDLRIVPLPAISGTEPGRLWVLRDISRQMELQEQLHQRQKIDSIGEMAGGIAHDFNNMLTGIVGAGELLRKKVGPEFPYKKYIDSVLKSAETATQLARRLLLFARRSGAAMEIIDVHKVAEDALQLMERSLEKGITLHSHLNAEQSTVRGAPSLLESVLVNLGINARDAMDGHGMLTLSTHSMETESPTHAIGTTLAPGPWLQISITDNGCGMDEETLSKACDPFFTTKETGKGTGLGLAMVHGTLIEHGGGMRISSSPGAGTTIDLFLPLVQGEALSEIPSDIVSGQGKLLIVDDEPMVRMTMREMLEDLGYDVVEAEDGYVAEEKYRRHNPDLVLLDRIMPRRSGVQTLEALAALDPYVRVVFVTGFAGDIPVDASTDERVLGTLIKPFKQSELSQVLAAQLGVRSPAPSNSGI